MPSLLSMSDRECEDLSEKQYDALEIQKEKLIPAPEIEERVLTLNSNS